MARLSEMFTYFDAIVTDTPILDVETRETLDVRNDLLGRLNRAKRFIEYLDGCWESCRDANDIVNWPIHSQAVLREIDRIERKR